MLEIVTRHFLLSFVIVTVCDALLEPTASVPKFMAEGLGITLACATVPNVNMIAMTAAML